MELLIVSACSDAGTSPTTGYPEPHEQATSESSLTTGSATSSGMGGQATTTATTGNENVGGQTSATTGVMSGQTSSTSAATSGQATSGQATSGQATSGQVTVGTGSTGQVTTPPLSFAADIWPLWNMVRDPLFVYRGMDSYSGCTDVGVCHGGGNPGAGLRMPDQQTAYAQMIDTPSVSSICAGTQRVAVGDPENSCLVLFYQGRLGSDDLGWVDDAEIDLMREWIRQGALP